MKLNWDCFYNVLQTIEQHSTTTSNLPFSIFGDLQKEYGKDQLYDETERDSGNV